MDFCLGSGKQQLCISGDTIRSSHTRATEHTYLIFFHRLFNRNFCSRNYTKIYFKNFYVTFEKNVKLISALFCTNLLKNKNRRTFLMIMNTRTAKYN